MNGSAKVKITPIPGAAQALARSAELHTYVGRLAGEAAAELRSNAPVRTGAGRRSIVAQALSDHDGWYGVAGWDPEHYYMGIQNSRTHWADSAESRIRYV